MDRFLLNRVEWARLYNCSRVDVDQVPLAQRQHLANGLVIIALFVAFECLYLPCVLAIRRHLSHSCYKILFFIAVVDIFALVPQGLLSGLFLLSGTVFCSSPTAVYLSGSIRSAFFLAETSANFILAIDRVLEMVSSKMAKALFGGNRAWLWMGVPCAIALADVWFVCPPVFSAIALDWFVSPFAGYSTVSVALGDYSARALLYYNVFLVVALPLVYALFLGLFKWSAAQFGGVHHQQLSGGNHSTNIPNLGFQKTVFVQVALITGLNVGSMLIHVAINYLPVSSALVLFGFYCNYFIFGLPPLIYLLFNRTIRNDCRTMIGQVVRRLRAQWRKLCPWNKVKPSAISSIVVPQPNLVHTIIHH